MSIVIIDKPEFEVTVTLATRQVKGDLKCRFVAYPQSDLTAMQAQAVGDGLGPGGVLRQVLVWFESVQLPGGLLDFDGPASVDKLIDFHGVGPALLNAYYKALWEEASGN